MKSCKTQIAKDKTFSVTGGSVEVHQLAGEGKYSQTGGTLETYASLVATDPFDPEKVKASEQMTVSNLGALNLLDDIDYTLAQYQGLEGALKLDNVIHFTEGNFIKGYDENGNVIKEELGNILNVGGNVAKSSLIAKVPAKGDTLTSASFDQLTLGSIELVPQDDVVSSFTVGSNDTNVVMRGDDNGQIFILSGDPKAFENTVITMTNTTFGAKDTDQARYDGMIQITNAAGRGLDVAHGNLTLGNVRGTGSINVMDGASLTVVGATTTQEMPSTDPDADPVAYEVLTIGQTQIQDPITHEFKTATEYTGATTVQNGGVFVTGDYQRQALAKFAELDARLTADALAHADTPLTAEDVKNSMIYIGQETRFNTLPDFAEAQGEGTNFVYVDLNGVAAHGYSTDRSIISTAEQDGTIANTGMVVFDNLNKAVVATAADGTKYVNVGSAVNNAVASFGTIFYRGDMPIKNGQAFIEIDTEELSDLGAFGFNSYGAVKQQLETFEVANVMSDRIIRNMGALYDNFDNGVYESVKNLLSDGVTQSNFEDALDNGKLAQILKDPQNELAVRDFIRDAENAFIKDVREAEHAQTNMAVYGGAFSTAIDINNEVWKALDRRTSLANLNVARNATGITPWVDVLGTWNAADSLYGSSGYEADIYGAVIGADWTASCGAILCLAFNVGQADANSKDSATKVENDVDFWGVSLYGSHQIGHVNGKFDLGYISTSNDLSAHSAYFGRTSESLDADIFTIGLGAEYLANVGALNVVPHAGIRWTRLDMDDSKYGADYDAMNLFQMPLGVTFSGTFDMSGWKVAPMFDLSVIPTFGDKDAVANYAGGIDETIRVVDSNPVQATLGVNASVDAWTFGVNYGLSAGSDDRLNNSFNLNARYTF